MSFINKTDEKIVRLTMTDYGKEKLLSDGVGSTFQYFSLTDDDMVYWLSELPVGILEITGYHENSTDKNDDRFKYTT